MKILALAVGLVVVIAIGSGLMPQPAERLWFTPWAVVALLLGGYYVLDYMAVPNNQDRSALIWQELGPLDARDLERMTRVCSQLPEVKAIVNGWRAEGLELRRRDMEAIMELEPLARQAQAMQKFDTVLGVDDEKTIPSA